MEKKRGRLIEIVGSIAAATVVVLFLWIALNQPVPASTQSPNASPPQATNPAPADQTKTPPASAPEGPQSPPSEPTSPQTPPTPRGNGHKVPEGWANAACPDNGKGKGVQARCEFTATYGAMKQAGLAGLIQSPSSLGKTQASSQASPGSLHASANGNSAASGRNPGNHNGQR